MKKIVTTAQLRDEAGHCRRLAGGINGHLTTKLLAALAEIFATGADEQAASETRKLRSGALSLTTCRMGIGS
jgi:hypothetical protein